jgi:hypothetical protein
MHFGFNTFTMYDDRKPKGFCDYLLVHLSKQWCQCVEIREPVGTKVEKMSSVDKNQGWSI